jgi:hypothetical protein
MFDASALPATTTKARIRWRATDVTLIRLGADGVATPAYLLDDKRLLVDRCSGEDLLLLVRPLKVPPRLEVLVVDDLDQARSALVD